MNRISGIESIELLLFFACSFDSVLNTRLDFNLHKIW